MLIKSKTASGKPTSQSHNLFHGVFHADDTGEPLVKVHSSFPSLFSVTSIGCATMWCGLCGRSSREPDWVTVFGIVFCYRVWDGRKELLLSLTRINGAFCGRALWRVELHGR